jgi:hypothetical protein
MLIFRKVVFTEEIITKPNHASILFIVDFGCDSILGSSESGSEFHW